MSASLDDELSLEEPGPQTLKVSPPVAALTTRRRGAEFYDTLLWRVRSRADADAEDSLLVGVTAGARRSGVSTVAANLAIRAADHHMAPALLVDANLTHPRVQRVFRLQNVRGLADVLSGGCALEEALHTTRVDGLEVLPMGTPSLLDRLSVEPQRVAALLQQLRERYRFVVFDLPEAEQLRNALLFARSVDTALFVIRSESIDRSVARLAIDHLRQDGVPLAGAVVTCKRQYAPKWLVR